MGMIIDRRRVCGKSLPYDAEIAYLGSNGTQYIDTDVYVTQYPLKVETEAYFVGSNNEQDIFGNYNSDYHIPIIFGKYGNSFHVWSGVRWIPASLATNTWYTVVLETLSTSSLKIMINGTVYTSSQPNNVTSSNNSSIYLFCAGSSKESYLAGRIGYVKIYINNVLVRDFIPVRVGSVGYMYDKVSKQLFGNEGTGDFILGPDK